MGGNDRFDRGEGTIIKPSPGGRRGRVESAPPSRKQAEFGRIGELETAGVNPILAAATTLLTIAGQLRRSASYDDISGLFRDLCQEIRTFESRLVAIRQPAEHASSAGYILCGFLDEAILNTPWGSESVWGNRTLLAEFHNEAYAGEKVFDWLERMKTDPSRYLLLLELIYVCLSLGFQGKYRRHSRGSDELERIRSEVHRLVSYQRGSPEQELSPHWRGVEDSRPKLAQFVPVWMVAAISVGVLALVVFPALWLTLNAKADPVLDKVARLDRGLEPVVAQRVVQTPARPQTTLKDLLESDLRNGSIELGKNSNTIIVRSLFGSGSAEMSTGRDLLQRISDALKQLDGQVVVSGHSDNQPIRSLRYPSNWDLSKARASAVVAVLGQAGVVPNRMVAEPRADVEPICPSCNQDDLKERERNRRVEIELMGQAKGA